MVRISTTDAGGRFPDLLRLVLDHGEVIELEENGRVLARIEPASSEPLLPKDLGNFFASLPALGEDAAGFENDLESSRESMA